MSVGGGVASNLASADPDLIRLDKSPSLGVVFIALKEIGRCPPHSVCLYRRCFTLPHTLLNNGAFSYYSCVL